MSYGYQGQQFQLQAQPPTSFMTPPSAPSAPASAPSYPPIFSCSNYSSFSNVLLTSFGMPQLYSQAPTSYPTQPMHPMPGIMPTQTNAYPPISQQMPYPPQPMPTSCYPPNTHISQPVASLYPQQQNYNNTSQPAASPYPQQQNYNNTSQPAASPYSQQQNYNMYPNLQKAPEIREYFGSMSPSPYPGPNVHIAIRCSFPYQDGSYLGGQGVHSTYPYDANPSTTTIRGATTAPRRDQFTPKTSPTVVPYDGFDARADAEILRKSMKGFSTDEKSIIHVLANRSNLQRQEIASQFKTLYGKDLIKDLKSELSGNFEKLALALMTPLPQYYAKELHDAMSGIGTDETVLIEVLCTMSNHEISIIKQAYEAMYERTLEDDLISNTSGKFKRLMVPLCFANRDETFNVNQTAAKKDAKRLSQAGELRFDMVGSRLNTILMERNVAQLRQIFIEYQNITGHNIEDAIENESSGDIRKGLLAMINCVKNRAGFFAEQLYKSMKGLSTDDSRLIRLVVTRCEVDMDEIKSVFLQQYGESLEDFISDDCSGHYKNCLLALVF